MISISKTRQDELIELRRSVWAKESVDIGIEKWEPLDDDSNHYGVELSGEIVAAIRISDHLASTDLPIEAGLRKFVPPGWNGYLLFSRFVADPKKGEIRASMALLDETIQKYRDQYPERLMVGWTSNMKLSRILQRRGWVSMGAANVNWGNRSLESELLVRAKKEVTNSVI